MRGYRAYILSLAFGVCLAAIAILVSPQVAQGATGHGVDLTWTASTSVVTGLGYNVYRGTVAGAESATPVNTTLITSTAWSDANVTPNTTYYYVVKACVGTVCSGPSNEAAATVPLVSGDLSAPTGLGASAH